MIYLPDIEKIYLGTSGVTKIMQGDVQVWPLSKGYYEEYTTFVVVGDGTGTLVFETELNIDIQFSKNGGVWKSYSGSTAQERAVTKGDRIRLKGRNDRYSETLPGAVIVGSSLYITGVDYSVEGNIMSLIYSDNFIGNDVLPTYTFHIYSEGQNFDGLFGDAFNSRRMVDAGNLILPAKKLTPHCYEAMFESTKIKRAPQIWATDISGATEACQVMFRWCYELEESPILYAVEPTGHAAYDDMFYKCTNLKKVTCLLRKHTFNYSDTVTSLGWLEDVSPTGTFVKNTEAPSDRNEFWIPSGWTIENYTEEI